MYRIILIIALLCFTPYAFADMPQLMGDDKREMLESLIPETENERINEIVNGDIMIYTRAEMPNIYWHNGTFKDANYDIGPANAPKPHNGSRDFPWNDPGGTHRCGDEVASFKWMYLPEGKPVVWFTEPMNEFSYLPLTNEFKTRPTNRHTYRWMFPVGTVFGEVLVLRGEDNKDHAFEMRTRKRGEDKWFVDVFRPFPRAQDLLDILPKDNPVAKHLMNSDKVRTGRLVDAHHPNTQAINVEAKIDVLPPIDAETVSYLLDNTVFKSAVGAEWREDCPAPTTKASYHIVPRNYDGVFVGNDRTGCIKCHESTGENVDKFDFGRDWYGLIRGSDRILSWHPIDPKTLTKDASTGRFNFRPEFDSILERYDPSIHKNYHPLSK